MPTSAKFEITYLNIFFIILLFSILSFLLNYCIEYFFVRLLYWMLSFCHLYILQIMEITFAENRLHICEILHIREKPIWRTKIENPVIQKFHILFSIDNSIWAIQVWRQRRGEWVGSENGNFCWFTVLFMLT